MKIFLVLLVAVAVAVAPISACGFAGASFAGGYCPSQAVVVASPVVYSTPVVQTYAVQQIAAPQLVAAPAPVVSYASPAPVAVAAAPVYASPVVVATAPYVQTQAAFCSYNAPSFFNLGLSNYALSGGHFHGHGVNHTHH